MKTSWLKRQLLKCWLNWIRIQPILTRKKKKMNEPLVGNFEGIGVQFNMVEDTLFVIQPVSNGPSEKVGILAGDRIVAVNDTAIAGVKMSNGGYYESFAWS